ncbi:MAG: L(+)-tartrate dehydratase subunit alpha, partial [Thaumarchaeota archaeon]
MDLSGAELRELLVKFIKVVATKLPDDVLKALREEREAEEDPVAKRFYEMMLDNARYAAEKEIPICQDTGVPFFFIKLGTKSPYLSLIPSIIEESMEMASKEIPLRPNAVDPVTDENLGDNVGPYVPWIEYELLPDSDLTEITLLLSGGGSSLLGRSTTFKPLNGFEEMIDFIVDAVAEYGVNACPPLFIGIGIGATSEIASILAKRALLREIGSRNRNNIIAEIEELLLRRLNELKIGVQGYGAGKSVLDVHIEYS